MLLLFVILSVFISSINPIKTVIFIKDYLPNILKGKNTKPKVYSTKIKINLYIYLPVKKNIYLISQFICLLLYDIILYNIYLKYIT